MNMKDINTGFDLGEPSTIRGIIRLGITVAVIAAVLMGQDATTLVEILIAGEAGKGLVGTVIRDKAAKPERKKKPQAVKPAAD